jgi:hypothetical protein
VRERKKNTARVLLAAGAAIDLFASSMIASHVSRTTVWILLVLGCSCLAAAAIFLVQARRAA